MENRYLLTTIFHPYVSNDILTSPGPLPQSSSDLQTETTGAKRWGHGGKGDAIGSHWDPVVPRKASTVPSGKHTKNYGFTH